MAARILSLLLALLLLVAGCAGDGGDAGTVATDAAGSADSDPQGDADAAAVPEALRFTATTVDGGTFEGADYAGQDLMLWFWAPW